MRLATLLLVFSGKQPLYRFTERPANPQQYLRSYLLFAAFHIREMALTNSDPSRKFFLRHLETSKLPNPLPDMLPVERNRLAPPSWP